MLYTGYEPKQPKGPRLDPREPLLHSERTQGFAADPDYWKGEVFAYVGRNQNLKDLKDLLWKGVSVGYVGSI